MTDYRRERQSYLRRAGGDEGGQMQRWKDCVKRDVKNAVEEEDWKKKTRDGGGEILFSIASRIAMQVTAIANQ